MATNRFLKAQNQAISLAFDLGRAFERNPSISNCCTPATFLGPEDSRTGISHLGLDPAIRSTLCCPTCFSLHPPDAIKCTTKATKRSKACNTELWTICMTPNGPRTTPKRHFYTQSLLEWLKSFLSRPGIEELIDRSYQHVPNPQAMGCLWDSPAWQDLPGQFSTIPGNLTFSIYIDWFNPFTNKIAGKTVSAGIILATCLNIPYELQESLGATCHLGITPLPRKPSVSTINNLSLSVVTELEELFEGTIISTFRHPEGIQKRVGVLPVIADLLGIRKLLGYAAVNAHKFCSFCDLDHNKLSTVGHSIGNLRTGEDVRRAGRAYLDASTIEKRKTLLKASGVRFSTVQQISYRDPVRHTVLGMMHNWLEGILQHHAREKWGIGGLASKTGQIQKTESMTEDAYEENEAEMYTDTLTDSGVLSMVESVDHMDVDIPDNQEQYEITNSAANTSIC